MDLSKAFNSLNCELIVRTQIVTVRDPDKCSFMLLSVDDELQTNLVCGNETLKQ